MKLRILKKWKNESGKKSVLPVGIIIENKPNNQSNFSGYSQGEKFVLFVGDAEGTMDNYIKEMIKDGKVEEVK